MLFADRVIARGLFHGYYGLEAMLYFSAQDILLDLPDLKVRGLANRGFKGKEKVLIWYGQDDEESPPSHGKWMAMHFEAECRILNGFKHIGASAVQDHETFLERLVTEDVGVAGGKAK